MRLVSFSLSLVECVKLMPSVSQVCEARVLRMLHRMHTGGEEEKDQHLSEIKILHEETSAR